MAIFSEKIAKIARRLRASKMRALPWAPAAGGSAPIPPVCDTRE